MDPQSIDFPARQPYEGIVAARNDPLNIGRVKVEIPGVWEAPRYGPWCLVVGGKFGGAKNKGTAAAPPLGADVLVFFVNGEAENPRVLAAHFGIDEPPEGAAVTDDGDNKVFQDERLKIEVDARADSYGVRITDLLTGEPTSVDVDMNTSQVGISTTLGVLIKSTAHVRIEAGLVSINGRPVLNQGPPI